MKKFKSMHEYAKYLNCWIRDYLIAAKKDGVVLGISGGIDSAVVLALCLMNKDIKVIARFFNIKNSSLDKKCIKDLETTYKIKIKNVNFKKEVKSITKKLKIENELAIANIKPRMRMLSLYALAQQHNALVIGTSNLDELYLGYYTKFGDGACDLAPIAHLNKREVYQLAHTLNVPYSIINRAPSASLYENQTDEKELDITYEEIDNFLDGKKVSRNSLNKIKKWHNASLHKSALLKTPEPFKERKI